MQESGPVACCNHVGRQLIESMLDVTVTTGWLVGWLVAHLSQK